MYICLFSVDHTVGVLFLNAAETWVDVENSRDTNMVSSIVSFVSGTQAEERVSARFISEAGIMEVYVMLGPSPADCFKQYTTLTGTAPLPQVNLSSPNKLGVLFQYMYIHAL